MAVSPYSVPASLIIAELARCQVTHFVTMPDYVQLAVNRSLLRDPRPGLDVVNCATEDEAIAIAYGLHVGGKTPYLSMQNQGLLACINALFSLGVNSRTPLPILVGQWGRELDNLGKEPSESRRLIIRRTEPLLDALNIPHFRVETSADVPYISKAFKVSHDQQTPAVVLIGAHASWD